MASAQARSFLRNPYLPIGLAWTALFLNLLAVLGKPSLSWGRLEITYLSLGWALRAPLPILLFLSIGSVLLILALVRWKDATPTFRKAYLGLAIAFVLSLCLRLGMFGVPGPMAWLYESGWDRPWHVLFLTTPWMVGTAFGLALGAVQSSDSSPERPRAAMALLLSALALSPVPTLNMFLNPNHNPMIWGSGILVGLGLAAIGAGCWKPLMGCAAGFLAGPLLVLVLLGPGVTRIYLELLMSPMDGFVFRETFMILATGGMLLTIPKRWARVCGVFLFALALWVLWFFASHLS